MDCMVHGVAKSRTRLSDFHFHITNTLAWRIPWTEEPGGLQSMGFPVAQLIKNLPAMQETWVQFLGWEEALEKGKAAHSSILAWRIPRTV